MKTKDILGQDMPILEVNGLFILPPPLFVLNDQLPKLIGYIRNVVTGQNAGRDSVIRALLTLLSYRARSAMALPEKLQELSEEEIFLICAEYFSFIRETIPNLPYCAVPIVPDDNEDDGITYSYPRYTATEKIVADYAKLSLTEVYQLNYVDYLILLREAFIHALSQTKKGRERLEIAYCSEQTEPDRAALRAKFGGEEVG